MSMRAFFGLAVFGVLLVLTGLSPEYASLKRHITKARP